MINLNQCFSANCCWLYPLHCCMLSDVAVFGVLVVTKMSGEYMVIYSVAEMSRKAMWGNKNSPPSSDLKNKRGL